jgi:hypothetical protein
MSTKRIIYESDTHPGGIAILVPTDEYLKDHTIEDVAKKDVPKGKKYKITDLSALPTISDRSFRNAWTADFSTYDGIGT